DWNRGLQSHCCTRSWKWRRGWLCWLRFYVLRWARGALKARGVLGVQFHITKGCPGTEAACPRDGIDGSSFWAVRRLLVHVPSWRAQLPHTDEDLGDGKRRPRKLCGVDCP